MSQFCRACGSDLRAVRAGLERADAVANPAAAARAEIGLAIAEKIRELRGAAELKTVAEDVLPKVEGFLESPEEKRLRRMRAGVITAAIGLGAMLMFVLIAITEKESGLFFPAGLALVAFLLGLGMIINGKLLTAPKKELAGELKESPLQDALGRLGSAPAGANRELPPGANPPLSVVEHTTHRLPGDPIAARRPQSPVKGEG